MAFTKGQLVNVRQRQWPGVNKEGGVARIVKLNDDSTVAVSYVLRNYTEPAVDLKVGRSRPVSSCERISMHELDSRCSHFHAVHVLH